MDTARNGASIATRNGANMEPTTKAIVDQINYVLGANTALVALVASQRMSNSVPDLQVAQACASLAACIERFCEPNSQFRLMMQKISSGPPNWTHIEPLYGVLTSLRDAYASGHLQTLRELIHADVFSDFLESAAYLLGDGYKDASAVIVGSSLEAHLRKLADKFSVPTTKPDGKHIKADTISADLVKAGAYNQLDAKSVIAWLGLRNDAAHGDYEKYTKEQVALMLDGVRNFMTRVPA